jgi:hypothetical protein
MKQHWPSLLVILIVIIAAYLVVQTVRQGTQQALQPLRQANNAIGTQVSDLLHPTPTVIPDPVTIIHDVRALARLETIQYTVEKVETCQVRQGTFSFAFGDRVLFVGHGYVIAGIDMEKLMPDDMRVDAGVLYVTLPASEVFVSSLDNDKSYVYDRETGLLVKPTVDLETKCRQVAQDDILQAALADGVLEQAQTNAENYLYRFFQALGYQNVIFVK